MTDKSVRMNTRAVHDGEIEPRIDGAVVLPIFQTAMYETGVDSNFEDVRYIRMNNTPNHRALNAKLAALEGAEDALVTGSGMAAISAALLAVLKQGDHLLIQSNLYGGTHGFVTNDFPDFGIDYDFFDTDAPDTWSRAVKPNTKAVYIESISNPLMRVTNARAIADFARQHNLVSMIDNTFTSPVNFRPSEVGIDLSLHSGSKYLNGHSDLVAGAIIGKRDLIEKAGKRLLKLGGTLDPHACFLLHRGIKTLGLRVRTQNENAMKIATFLSDQPAVATVNYPGLAAHPGHGIAAELFDGFGGMLSFELRGGAKAARALFERVRLPLIAPSLGGVESLMTRPAGTSHALMTPAERDKLGIADGLVRMSVGIEDSEDLLEDLAQAFAGLN